MATRMQIMWTSGIWLAIVIHFVYSSTPKTITISLDSKWRHTPFHLETSEFLQEEGTDCFWRYVRDFQSINLESFVNSTPKVRYETALELASRQLSPAKVSLLKLSHALRAHSPAVETFQQIAQDKHLPSDCNAILEVGGKFVCDLNEFEAALSSAKDLPAPVLYKIDHVYPGSSPDVATVILYGNIGTPAFKKFHQMLEARARKKELTYVLRHFVRHPAKQKVRLSGYGVELAIKSTEYKAQDDTVVKDDKKSQDTDDAEKAEVVDGFDFKRLKDLHPDHADKLNEFKSHLLDSHKEVANLKVWELQELSLQLAQKVLSMPVEEALRMLRDIVQNFPSQARYLIHINVDSKLKKEVERNQHMFMQHLSLEPTDTALFINGLYYDMEITDLFTLIQILKQETRILEGLHRIGLTGQLIPKLMKLDLMDDKQEYGVDIRDSAVLYVNDIESDKQYRNWPSSVQDMLRPTYPGMLRNVRKNMYHLVIIADPSKKYARDIIKLAESFYVHRAPLRIGLVFAVNSNSSVTGFQDGGVAMLNAFNFISQDKTPYDGLSFITDVYAGTNEDITADEVIKQFKAKYPKEELELVFGEDSDYDTGRKLAWDFINKTGIGAPPQVLMNGVLLKQAHLNSDMFEEAVLTEIMKQTPVIQKSIYKGDLSDFNNVLDFLMGMKNIMPRLNQRILSTTGTYLDLTGRVVEDLTPDDFTFLSIPDMAATFASKLRYLMSKDAESYRPLTFWIVGDFNTEIGRTLLAYALDHLAQTNDIRVAVIPNSKSIDPSENVITNVIIAATQSFTPNIARHYIRKIIKDSSIKDILSGKKTPEDFVSPGAEMGAFKEALQNTNQDFLKTSSTFCEKVLNLLPGDRAVVGNGRVIGPFGYEEFNEDDFNLLEKYSLNVFGEKIKKVIQESEDESALNSDLGMKVSSVLLSNSQSKVRHDLKYSGDEHSALKIPASNPDEPAHEIVAIFDPVSRGSQKISQILLVLQHAINANIKIFFNCIEKHSDMPLKSYYRFVLEPEIYFNPDESLVPGPVARFLGMPTSPLLTLGMATPENWLVEAVRSPYDLDNIHMEKVDRVSAEFELEYLLLEGHCFEQSTGNPPRGLQFTLGTASSPVLVDTIVMANLGYFQMKANPGTWYLKLRQGRSAELYDIVSHENTDTPPGSEEAVVLLSSFRSHVIKVKVSKKPGKQAEDLLSDSEEDTGDIWSSIANIPVIGGLLTEWKEIGQSLFSTFGSESKKKDDEEEDDKINIFSLASGHLYERLLRIMMLSVLKNTKTPVKFWFLKNYLSPTFKDFLPYMAKEHGFEYELVQYKWPRWLNQQTEKQRIIWGYKILFLDVLFPLDVKKIIFVDADQVVRADMKELRDLDLGGAPYGYTPFCESRQDMDGYRFWKSGYWSSHLGGRKYHISALYVVDLKKFRRIAAGDRLRGQYQGLSQDPNSLSNLDQDLPNNMIHQVAIKSLPQEWLWCETWCDDESKKYAKTIDLCNNPKTKEPKLVSAARIIPEWKTYDEELKNLLEKYDTEKDLSKTSLPEQSIDESIHVHQEL